VYELEEDRDDGDNVGKDQSAGENDEDDKGESNR
jgi:hypothetical protein